MVKVERSGKLYPPPLPTSISALYVSITMTVHLHSFVYTLNIRVILIVHLETLVYFYQT